MVVPPAEVTTTGPNPVDVADGAAVTIICVSLAKSTLETLTPDNDTAETFEDPLRRPEPEIVMIPPPWLMFGETDVMDPVDTYVQVGVEMMVAP